MERKIGEIFKYNDVTLKVVEDNACANCYFRFLTDCYNKREITGACSCTDRKDRNSVIFKEIKSMNEEVREITLPEGFVVDKIVDGKIILKVDEKLDSWKKCINYLKHKEKLEYVDAYSNIISPSIEDHMSLERDSNYLPEGHGEAMLALSQLLICRNAWWKKYNCKPESDETGYGIVPALNEVKFISTYPRVGFFSFNSREIRDNFYRTFKDLFNELYKII